ncbi:helix-turn-helix domain-containing protein [Nocardia carnea]|uniref:helix-turn-helix domain-containing protein n=1 Tax=Nocardia carnea TaxID=37328 RepID=UPI003D788A22
MCLRVPERLNTDRLPDCTGLFECSSAGKPSRKVKYAPFMGTDADIETALAERLLALRQEHGHTLSELARRTGLSAAHLSRLEKGIRQPSIGALLQLARCYELTLGQLVGEEVSEPYHLVRSASAGRLYKTDSASYRVLSGPGLPVSVVEVVIASGQVSGTVSHRGLEWLHVLSGAIDLSIERDVLILDEGDSIQFDAGRQHQISVRGQHSARLLLASTTVVVLPPG